MAAREQLRLVPRAEQLDRVVDVVDDALDALRADGDRQAHDPEHAVPLGERPELVVREVARVVVDGAAAGVAHEHGSVPRDAVEHGVVRARRSVREVDQCAELDEAVDEPLAERAETAVVLDAETVGERVPVVPGEPDHADAQVPEGVDQARVLVERLDALEREHQP
jgi:hypothetical protein